MSLYNILFNRVSKKLKLETSKLEEEIIYTKKLLETVSSLKELKKNNYKSSNFYNLINKAEKKSEKLVEDFFVMYIISISFLKANTVIHVLDIKGNTKLFYTAGNVNLVGKQKKQRRLAILRLISLLAKKAMFIGRKPVALHLNNIIFHKPLIINKLKRNFFIRLIKSFNQAPYNGCRKKKIRRKKYSSKKIKK